MLKIYVALKFVENENGLWDVRFKWFASLWTHFSGHSSIRDVDLSRTWWILSDFYKWRGFVFFPSTEWLIWNLEKEFHVPNINTEGTEHQRCHNDTFFCILLDCYFQLQICYTILLLPLGDTLNSFLMYMSERNLSLKVQGRGETKHTSHTSKDTAVYWWQCLIYFLSAEKHSSPFLEKLTQMQQRYSCSASSCKLSPTQFCENTAGFHISFGFFL